MTLIVAIVTIVIILVMVITSHAMITIMIIWYAQFGQADPWTNLGSMECEVWSRGRHPLDASCAQVRGHAKPVWANFQSIAKHFGPAGSILRALIGLRVLNRSATSMTAHT